MWTWAITKDGPPAVPIGRDAAYGLEFRNTGNTDARNVRLEERLSDGMQFVRADGGGRFDAARSMVVWEFPRLAPGSVDRVTYVARVEASAGRLQTDTAITSDEPDRAGVDNTTTTFLTVLPEDVADREVWSPGSTARESVDRLGALRPVGRRRRAHHRHHRRARPGRAGDPRPGRARDPAAPTQDLA